MARRKTKQVATARTARARHRPHLIDACISALHLYGPSKTTVDKVVALAGLSPGIVRFYFDSKDAMLVASLEFLASEFEQRLLLPVSERIDDPVRALNLLVDLYLGAELASTRKVSVWYSFWGEASSRQEYYDICGARDAKFEALVHDLTRRLLEREPSGDVDADAIALGLIGTLEMLWQGFAFQTESAIDRGGSRRRAENYLRSVFPHSFGRHRHAGPGRDPLVEGWVYAGRAIDLKAGCALAVEAPLESLLLSRSPDGTLHASANRCPVRPHVVLDSPGARALDSLECRAHGLQWDLAGAPGDAAQSPLPGRACLSLDGLIWAATSSSNASPASLPTLVAPNAAELGSPEIVDHLVDADWQVLTDLWGPAEAMSRRAPLGRVAGWSADRLRTLEASAPGEASAQYWVAPGQILDTGLAGLTVTAIHPIKSGAARVRQWRYDRAGGTREARIQRYLLCRLLREGLRLAAAVQRGVDADAMAQTLGRTRFLTTPAE